jgi:ABC-type nitrate/sulfonate/bicarbonate transport system substrate-binding protein
MNRSAALRLGGSAAVAAAGCAFFPARARAQAMGVPLRIVGARNDSGAEIYYAQDLGMYADAGLDAHPEALNATATMAAAVMAGDVTIAGMTIPGLALAHEKGLPLVIVAPSAIYSSAAPTAGIFVLKDSPYKKASDLNGKTLTTLDISNMGYYGAKAWIDRNGGDSKSIKWFEMPESAALAAMQAGRVDAAEVSEPSLDIAIHGPDARLLAPCYDAIGDRFLISAFFTSAGFAKAHPDIVQRFCDVILKAGVWANKNHAQSAKILEKYIGVPIPPSNTRATYSERVRPADAQPVLDVLLHYGALKKPLRAADLFAPEIHVES